MNEKERLLGITRLNDYINNRLEEIMRLRDMMTRTTSMVSDAVVTRTRNVTGIQDAIAAVIDLENELNTDIDRLVDMKRDAERLISKVDDPLCKSILTYRYINCWTWKKIAKAVNLCERSVYRAHSRALEKLSEAKS